MFLDHSTYSVKKKTWTQKRRKSWREKTWFT